MQTSMKRGTLSGPFQCKPDMAFFKVIFFISNDVFGGTLWVKLNVQISKSGVLLANEHQSDQKKMLQMIFV